MVASDVYGAQKLASSGISVTEPGPSPSPISPALSPLPYGAHHTLCTPEFRFYNLYRLGKKTSILGGLSADYAPVKFADSAARVQGEAGTTESGFSVGAGMP